MQISEVGHYVRALAFSPIPLPALQPEPGSSHSRSHLKPYCAPLLGVQRTVNPYAAGNVLETTHLRCQYSCDLKGGSSGLMLQDAGSSQLSAPTASWNERTATRAGTRSVRAVHSMLLKVSHSHKGTASGLGDTESALRAYSKGTREHQDERCSAT